MTVTVADLIEKQAKVFWRCLVCEGTGPVDLQAVLAAKGPAFSLVNRRPRCRKCPGRVKFMDQTRHWPAPLDTITDRDDAWWDFNDAERRRLQAAGWTLKMGHWADPDGLLPWERKTPAD